MFRVTTRIALIFVASACHTSDCPGQVPDNFKDADWFTPSPQVVRKLCAQHKFSGLSKTGLTVSDVLTELSDGSGLTFVLNTEAFKKEGMPNVGQLVLVGPPLSQKDMATPSRILCEMLKRVPVKSRATFIVSKNWVEITTRREVMREYWPEYCERTIAVVREIIRGRIELRELVQLFIAGANLKAAFLSRVLAAAHKQEPSDNH